mmetsp:Transcript_7538/g.7766  ORF Transcript_7538/g.7766 Transcript_7538/m.7766 type:complete len:606 (+) Transcript_7538:346-2163(+)
MSHVLLSGDISIEEVKAFLLKYFPTRNIEVSDGSSCKDNNTTSEIERLKELLILTEKDRDDLDTNLLQSAQAIQKLHQQQRAMFDEFSLLRKRYDDLKDGVHDILWTHCGQYHPELVSLPKIQDNINEYEDTNERIGEYTIGTKIGEGQFATVWTCYQENLNIEQAIKCIGKEKITTFNEVRNISREISLLKELESKYIINLIDTIQTKGKLYIITEKGGLDLFEFFDQHSKGVPEKWARDIIGNIVAGVTYCHINNVCHRDLKPENILMEFDNNTGEVKDLKICDFGLATKYSADTVLSEFCGSPGFFAPEMVILGDYYGHKVDVWSIGCIALELLLGNDIFCNHWLNNFEHDILIHKLTFEKRIQNAVLTLPSLLHFSTSLNEFITDCLTINQYGRLSVISLCQHPWIKEMIPNDLLQKAIELSSKQQLKVVPTDDSIAVKRRGSMRRGSFGRGSFTGGSMNSIRQRIEDVKDTTAHIERMRIPIQEPLTPNLGAARTLLQAGQKVAVQSLRESIKERRLSAADNALLAVEKYGTPLLANTKSNCQSAPRISFTEDAISNIMHQNLTFPKSPNTVILDQLSVQHLTPRRRSIVLTPLTIDEDS